MRIKRTTTKPKKIRKMFAATLALICTLAGVNIANADTSISDYDGLRDFISEGSGTGNVTTNITAGGNIGTVAINGLTLNGDGYTIDGGNILDEHSGFTVLNAITFSIQNLTMQNFAHDMSPYPALHIDNGGTVNLSGTNLFQYNMIIDTDGDIYNAGILNITGGSTNICGGIVQNAGHTVVSEGATLNLSGESAFSNTTYTDDISNSGTINIDGTVKMTKGITGSGTTNIDDGTIDMRNGTAGETLTISKLGGTTANFALDFDGSTKAIDNITVTATDGSVDVLVSNIKIVTDATSNYTDTVTWLTGDLDNITDETSDIDIEHISSSSVTYNFTKSSKGVLSVTSTGAGPSATPLEDAIQGSSPDVFDLTDSVYTVSRDLGNLAGADDRTFTINGNNDVDDRYIDGNSHAGVHVSNGKTLNLNQTTMKNFTKTGNGGVVYNEGTLNIADGKFLNNSASDTYDLEFGGGGGAIYNIGTIGDITGEFNYNSVTGLNDTDAHGGAIFNNGVIGDITADFDHNSATRFGGAIYSIGVSIGDITGDFTNNSAVTGGAIYNTATINSIKNSSFTSNTVSANGGAICNEAGTITINNTTFGGSDASDGNTAGSGGAIYNAINGTLSFTGTNIFSKNSATLGGGAINNDAILNITGTNTFSENTAATNGGAICNGATLDITGTNTFSKNSATSGGAIYGISSIANIIADFTENHATDKGGAIAVIPMGLSFSDTTVDAINGDFTKNYVDNSSGTAQGGAIYAKGISSPPKSTTIISSLKGTFENNYAKGATAQGGAIYGDSRSNITIDNGTIFKGNYTEGTTTSLGGAIYNTATTTINGANFEWNGYSDYNGTSANNATTQYGGAIYNKGTLSLTDTNTFSNNVATSEGGAIYLASGGTSTIIADFYSNKATGTGMVEGGAISNDATVSELSGIFSQNSAISTGSGNSANGGAICNEYVMSIHDSAFSGNSASGDNAYGGSIYNLKTLTISDTSFTNNYVQCTADAQGGAIANIKPLMGSGGVFNLDGTNTFSGNYTKIGSANSVANDIYNTGTINIIGGTTTINGGISDYETPMGIINIGGTTDGTLTLGEDATLTQKTLTINTNGKLIADTSQLTVTDTITNNGTFDISGNLISISGSTGTNVLQNDVTVTDGTTIGGILNTNGYTINMKDDSATYQTLNVGSLTGNGALTIDVDVHKTSGTTAYANDKINITSGASNSGSLNLSAINVTDATGYTASDYKTYDNFVEYVTGNASGITYKLMGDAATFVYDEEPGKKFTFTLGDDGKLDMEVKAGIINLSEFITATNGGDQVNTYSINTDYSQTGNIGTTADRASSFADRKTLSVFLNDGSDLTATGTKEYEGITVANGYTLNLTGSTKDEHLSAISNFTTALINNGTLNIADINLSGNTTDIYNAGTMNVNSGTTTIATMVQDGGRTIVANGATLNMTGGTFQNSSATVNGGAINNRGAINAITGSTFTNNSAISVSDAIFGGAIYNNGKITNGISNSIFTGNYAKSTNRNSQGGAIYTTGKLTLDGTTFKWNGYSDYNGTSASDIVTKEGGAICNESTVNFTGTNEFSNNAAESGGAIYNDNVLNFAGTNTFSNNVATSTGGAICNEYIVNFAGTNTFSNNVASLMGGAIYNTTEVNFAGTNTFSNNIANGVANDIYNEGTININGGTTTLNSGMVQDGGLTTVANGATFSVAGGTFENSNSSSYGGAINNAGTLNLSGTNTFFDNTAYGVANDIYNIGAININGGTTTINDAITGNGSITIGGTTDGTLSLGTGAVLNQSLLTTTLTGTLTATGATITTGNLVNSGTINLGGTSTGSSLSVTSQNSDIGGIINVLEGTHTLKVRGDRNNIASQISLNSDAVLNFTGGSILEGAQLSLDENSTLNITNSEDANSYVVIGEGDTWNGIINDNGFLYITGKATNTSDNAKLVISSGRTVNMTSADNIVANVENSGNLYLNTGTLSKAITGDGKTEMAGHVTLDDNGSMTTNIVIQHATGAVTANAGQLGTKDIQNGGTLNLTGGNLANNINKGTAEWPDAFLNINGTVTNNDGKTIDQKKMWINDGGKFSTNADKLTLTYGISNEGELTFTGGTNDDVITGDNGILKISGSTANTAAINQYAITVDSGKIFTSSGAITANSMTNSGTLQLNTGGSAIINAAMTQNGGRTVVNSGANLSVAGGTFQNTSTSLNGAAIYNAGGTEVTPVSISNATFNYNKRTGNDAGGGGAIYNGGYMTISGSSFTGNEMQKDYKAGNAGGGAIYNAGHLSITGANTFTNNVSKMYGGAICNYGGTIDSITADFTGNSAVRSYLTALGGAIYNSGTINSISGNFTNNYAQGPKAHGGAISSGAKNISGTFTGNRAISTSTKSSGRNAFGGALYNETSNATINADFTKNYAQGYYAYGGALNNAATSVSLEGDFTGNYTTGNYSQGGAIYNTGSITVNNSNFNWNGYSNYNGTSATSVATQYGGAIYNTANATLSFTETNTFTSNSASLRGGAIYNDGIISSVVGNFTGNHVSAGSGYAIGGAIYTGSSSKITDGITGSTFTGNYADGNQASGGAICINGQGSALQVGVINNVTFTKNYTESVDAASVGGALYTSGQIVNGITNSTFTGNYAKSTGDGSSKGGAIYNTVWGTMVELAISDTTFTGNGYEKYGLSGQTAVTKEGGAIYNNSGAKIGLTNTTFSNNAATVNGGAIYNTANSIINFIGTNTFSNNVVNSVLNDIYNAGSLNILSGTTSMEGGITDAATPTGVITIGGDTDGTLSLGDDATLVQKTLTVNEKGKLTANASGLNVNAISNVGIVELKGGSFTTTATKTYNQTAGKLTLDGSSLELATDASTIDGGEVDIKNSSSLVFNNAYANEAKVTMTGSGSSLTVQGNNTGIESLDGSRYNEGTITIGNADGGLLALSGDSQIAADVMVAVNSGGSIQLNDNSSLILNEGDVFSGNLDQYGGTFNVLTDISSGSGYINLSDGTLNIGDGLSTAGSLTFNNLSDSIANNVVVNINSNGTLTIQNNDIARINDNDTWVGKISLSGGNLILTGRDDTTDATKTYNQTAGTLKIDNSSLTLGTNGSKITNSSAVALKNAGKLIFDNSSYNKAILTTDTTANVLTLSANSKLGLASGSSIDTATRVDASADSVLVVDSGASLVLNAGSGNDTWAGVVQNKGTLTLDGFTGINAKTGLFNQDATTASTTVTNGFDLNNANDKISSGEFTVESGDLSVSNGKISGLAGSNYATIKVAKNVNVSGGSIAQIAALDIDGNMNITGGEVNYGGTNDSVAGTITQTAGTLNIVNSTSDKLAVSGGILNIKNTNTKLTVGDGTSSSVVLSIVTGDTNAKISIASGTTLDVVKGGSVILDGGSDLSKVDWMGDVTLNGGTLLLSNIVDKTRNATNYNKTGLLTANTGNLTINTGNVLLGDGDTIADAVVLTMYADITVGTGSTLSVTGDEWQAGKITVAGGTLNLNGVTTDATALKSLDANTGNLNLTGDMTTLANVLDEVDKAVSVNIASDLRINNTSANGVVLNDINEAGGDTWSAGAITLAGGNLTLDSSTLTADRTTLKYFQKADSTGTLNLINGSDFTIAGTFGSDISMIGGGTVDISGDSKLSFQNSVVNNSAILKMTGDNSELNLSGTNTDFYTLDGTSVTGGKITVGDGTNGSSLNFSKGTMTGGSLEVKTNSSLWSSGSAIQVAVSNNGTYRLTDGVITKDITGDNGQLYIFAGSGGTTTNTATTPATITQKKVLVDTGVTFTNDGSISAAIENRGTINLSANNKLGSLTLTGDSSNDTSMSITQYSITNLVGKTFTNKGTVNVSNFVNNGIIDLQNGSLTVTAQDSALAGTINATSGTNSLNVEGTVSDITSTIDIAAGANLQLNAGNILEAAKITSNTGSTLDIQGGSVVLNQAGSNADTWNGTVALNGGELTVKSFGLYSTAKGGVLDAQTGSLNVDGLNLNQTTDVIAETVSVDIKSGANLFLSNADATATLNAKDSDKDTWSGNIGNISSTKLTLKDFSGANAKTGAFKQNYEDTAKTTVIGGFDMNNADDMVDCGEFNVTGGLNVSKGIIGKSTKLVADTVSITGGEVSYGGTEDSVSGAITQTGGTLNIVDSTSDKLAVSGGILNIKNTNTKLTVGDGTSSSVVSSIVTGDTNAKISIASGTTLDVVKGGSVTLDGGFDLSKVDWKGDVTLNGGTLLLSNIVDKSRAATYNKSGKLIANTGDLTIDNTTVLLGNGDLIADAVKLKLSGDLNIGKDNTDTATVFITEAHTNKDEWTSGTVSLYGNGELTLNNVTTNANKSLNAQGGTLNIINAVNLLNDNDTIAEAVTTIFGDTRTTLGIFKGDVTLNATGAGADTLTDNTRITMGGGTVTLKDFNGANAITTSLTKRYLQIGGTLNLINTELTLSTADSSIKGGTVYLDPSVLTIQNGVSNHAIFDTSDSSIIVGGGTAKTTLTIDAGSDIDGTATITVNNAGVLNSASDYIKVAVTNDGTYNLTDGTIAATIKDSLNTGANGILNILGTGTTTNASSAITQAVVTVANGAIFINGGTVTAGKLTNEGTINGTGNLFVNGTSISTNASTGSITQSNITVTNGTFENNGIMNATVALNNSGTITNNADLFGNDVISNAGAVFTNNKNMTVANLVNGGTYTNSSDANLNVSTLISNEVGAIFTNEGLLSNASANISNSGTFTNGGDLFGNDVTNYAGAVFTNNKNMTVANLVNGGTYTNDTAGVMNVSNVIANEQGAVFANNGLLSNTETGIDNKGTFTNTGDVFGSIALNEAGAVFTNTKNITVTNMTNEGTFANDGTGLVVAHGTLENLSNAILTNNGTIYSETTFNNNTFGTVDGTGTLNVVDGINLGSVTQGKLNIAANNTEFSNGNTGLINITEALTNDGLFTNMNTVNVTNDGNTALFDNNSETRIGGVITTDTLKNDDAVIKLAQGTLKVTNQKIATGAIAGTINATSGTNNLSILGEHTGAVVGPTGQDFTGTLLIGTDADNPVVLNLKAGSVHPSATVNITENSVLNITGADADTEQMAVVSINANDIWDGEINVSNESASAPDSKIGLMLEGVTKEIGVDTADYYQTGGTLVLKQDHTPEGDFGTTFKLDDSSKISGGNLSIDDGSRYISGIRTGYHNGFNVEMLYSAGVVDSINGIYETHTINNLVAGNHLDNTADFMVDIYGRSNADKDYDRFSANAISTASPLEGTINISDWALNGNMLGGDAPTDRYISLPEMFSGTISDGQTINFTSTNKQVATPVGNYALVNHTNTANGFALELQSFNPEVYRGQVATVAQWENQLSIVDMLFTHSMVLPSFKEDLGDSKGTTGMYGNRYASSDPMYAPYQYSRKDGGVWCKMYGTFETLQMNNVGRVGNNAYGALIGADLGLKDLKHGWKFMPTAYIGYNGAYQTYPGVGMYQNGGQAGFLGTWYKDNVILGGLVYGGVYDNAMDVSGYNENTFNYFAGASAKAAYNWRFHRDWVLQPNLMVAYNFFGQQNWHSDYGQMSMAAGALNGINIAPGLNLIWEKETFSTYLTIQYMYNINGASGGQAGSISLPQVYMDRGYIQYGIGFTKKFSDRFSGYLQAVIRNAGRNGGAFQAGFVWTLGKGPSNADKTLKSSTVQPKATKIEITAKK